MCGTESVARAATVDRSMGADHRSCRSRGSGDDSQARSGDGGETTEEFLSSVLVIVFQSSIF